MLKLAAQIACGFIFAFSRNQITLLSSDIANIILTVVWVVTLMNSLNMLDNMDGINGTVTLFVILPCLDMDNEGLFFKYLVLIDGGVRRSNHCFLKVQCASIKNVHG